MKEPAIQRTKIILPDGMDERRLVIVKSCSYLRLTDEIRIASDAARETGRQFILAIGESCVLSPALDEFAKNQEVTLLRTAE